MNGSLRKAKGSPIMTSLILVGIVAAGITGVGTITGFYDAAHTSQIELDVVDDKVDAYFIQSKCQALRIQVTLVEQTIWELNQVQNDGQRLVDKKRDLRDLLSQYNTLNCASVLA